MDGPYEIEWVGWDNSWDGGTQHDKVWGWLSMKDGRFYCFFGRRGKTLRFKEHGDLYAVEKLQRQKDKKGYKFVDPANYDKLVQDFIEEVELYCMSAILADTVMPK